MHCMAEKPSAESYNSWIIAEIVHVNDCLLPNVYKEHPSLILPPRTCLCCLTIKPNGDCKRVSADKTSKCTQQVWSSRGKDRQMLQLRTAIRHWRSTRLNLLKLPLCAHGLCVCVCVCVSVQASFVCVWIHCTWCVSCNSAFKSSWKVSKGV